MKLFPRKLIRLFALAAMAVLKWTPDLGPGA
jgi:hypothetical protein